LSEVAPQERINALVLLALRLSLAIAQVRNMTMALSSQDMREIEKLSKLNIDTMDQINAELQVLVQDLLKNGQA
jgi:hypothetical protein